jgi:hypothetical protein
VQVLVVGGTAARRPPDDEVPHRVPACGRDAEQDHPLQRPRQRPALDVRGDDPAEHVVTAAGGSRPVVDVPVEIVEQVGIALLEACSSFVGVGE